jgi:hypothetical protein
MKSLRRKTNSNLAASKILPKDKVRKSIFLGGAKDPLR